MKRTQKRMLGFLGLGFVVATTIFAATLPGPEATATSTVTDNITVRVVGATPEIDITSPVSGQTYTNRYQTLSFNYENVETATVELKYTDASGVVHTRILDVIDANYNAETGTLALDLAGPDYGYGDYEITIYGESVEGVYEEDKITFSYVPVAPSINEDEDTGEISLGFDYDDDNDDIKQIVVDIYDENGNPVTGLSPIVVTPPTDSVELDFDSLDLPSGTYTITVTAYDENGNIIYKTYTIHFKYESVKTPNTGGLFTNLNISKSDYLTTGLIAFFIVGFAGLFYVAKSKKSTKGTKRR